MSIWEIITMKDIIIALISAAVAVICVVLTEILYGKRTFDLLKEHYDECSNNKNGLSNDHNKLSNEHKDIVGIQKSIYEKLKETDGKVFKINNLLIEEKTAQSLRYENLNDKQKDIKQYVLKIEDMARDWENQATIIKNLQEENIQLKEKIIKLERQHAKQRTVQDHEINDRTDYFER